MAHALYIAVLCRKVYLGYKKSNPCKKYAIKVMKKVDMINKNMASQGTFLLCWNSHLQLLKAVYFNTLADMVIAYSKGPL